MTLTPLNFTIFQSFQINTYHFLPTQALTNFNRDLRQMATLKQDNTGKLKEIQELIHQSIQIGCRLRVGQASAELMSQCMNVLKNTNSESNEQLANSLISLIQFGVNL